MSRREGMVLGEGMAYCMEECMEVTISWWVVFLKSEHIVGTLLLCLFCRDARLEC